MIFEFVELRKNDENFLKLLDYDVLIIFHQIHGYFYYKGILVKKDIKKAIDIFLAPLESKKSVKNYRKIYYYLGKGYKKIGDMENSNKYFKKAFEIYILLKEFPYHHYLMGKFFFKGIVVAQDFKKSFYFFNLGANYSENYIFINSLYSIKCRRYLNHEKFQGLQEVIGTNYKLDLDQYINEENLCIVCFGNFKQIIFTKCGHKAICYICLNKMKENNSSPEVNNHVCPICKQVSISFINDVN